MTHGQEAAAFHGMATNRGRPTTERLELALEACKRYERELTRRDHQTDARTRQILELHRPVIENVEWFDCVDDSGTAAVCQSCRPKDPTEWHPRQGEAGVRPEGFVPSYVLSPCPTMRAMNSTDDPHGDDEIVG